MDSNPEYSSVYMESKMDTIAKDNNPHYGYTWDVFKFDINCIVLLEYTIHIHQLKCIVSSAAKLAVLSVIDKTREGNFFTSQIISKRFHVVTGSLVQGILGDEESIVQD